MALTFTPAFISVSTNGEWIAVTATESPGQEIHTVQVTGTNMREEIRIIAVSVATSTQPLRLEWGSTETRAAYPAANIPDGNNPPTTVQGAVPLCATTTIIRAYTTGTATTGSIRVNGQINRAS